MSLNKSGTGSGAENTAGVANTHIAFLQSQVISGFVLRPLLKTSYLTHVCANNTQSIQHKGILIGCIMQANAVEASL